MNGLLSDEFLALLRKPENPADDMPFTRLWKAKLAAEKAELAREQEWQEELANPGSWLTKGSPSIGGDAIKAWRAEQGMRNMAETQRLQQAGLL